MSSFPIKSPRHVALVGLTMQASDAEFQAAWKRKFGEPGSPSTGPSVSSPPNAGPISAKMTGDEKVSRDAREKFLLEVDRLQRAGHTYDSAWLISSTTEPGQTYY